MPTEAKHRLEVVYGINRDLPLNYVVRKSADDRLVDSLSRGKHIVIYGSSKQGKTSLRKHCLKAEDYVVVHCSNKWSVADINAAILKRVGYEVTQSTSRTMSGQAKITARFGFGLFGQKSEMGGDVGVGIDKKTEKAPLELDPSDVNDIIRALQEIKFTRFIVLEDFHYLPAETQKDFAVALKAFHEESKLCFIIVGVWLEENRLTVYNGDLTGRVLSIDADRWEPRELEEVISAGEALLNVEFQPKFRRDLLAACFGSVHLVQEACYKACERDSVFETQPSLKAIGASSDARESVRSVVNEQTGRFNSFLTQFADGFQDTALQMYRWLLFPVLTSQTNDLERGLRFADIRRVLNQNHPEGKQLNPGNITQALLSTAPLQVKKDIKPIVLDYDQSNGRLRVVDRGFLIWLEMQDRDELLELAGLPRIKPTEIPDVPSK